MTLSNQSNKHLRFLDSIRAITAVYVVMHHAVVQYYDPSNSTDFHLSGLKNIFVKVFMHGHSAVNVFIVLSGFSLMLSVIKNEYFIKGGIWLFFKRRVIRIIPPYYFAILLSLVLIWLFIGQKTGTHWDGCIPVSKWDIITHVLMIHDFFVSTVGHIDHPLWSISVEFRIYLFFPLLVLVWRQFGTMPTLILSILIAVLGVFLLSYMHQFNSDILLSSSGINPYIILFTFGMIVANVVYSEKESVLHFKEMLLNMSFIKKGLCVVVYAVFFLLLKHFFKTREGFENSLDIGYNVNDLVFGSFAAFFLFVSAVYFNQETKKIWLLEILNWKPLAFVGTFSYSLYLIHAPLLQMISQYIIIPLKITGFSSIYFLTFIGTPLIMLFSYGFFWFFERPFLTLGKKKQV